MTKFDILQANSTLCCLFFIQRKKTAPHSWGIFYLGGTLMPHHARPPPRWEETKLHIKGGLL